MITGISFAVFEKVMDKPIKDKIFGVQDFVAEPIYKEAVTQIEERVTFLDVTISPYKNSYVEHKKTYVNKDDYIVCFNTYIIAVLITIHFELIGDKKIDIKTCVTDFYKKDNSSKVFEHFKLENGINHSYLWYVNVSWNNVVNLDSYQVEIINSLRDLAILMFDEIKACYNKNNEVQTPPNPAAHYDSYFEYYKNIEWDLYNWMDKSEKYQYPMAIFDYYLELNHDNLTLKYPLLYEYTGDDISSDSYYEENYDNDYY